MMTSSRATSGRAALVASLLAALLLSACGGGGVGEGNTVAFITITDGSGVQPSGDVEVFQCLPSRLFVVGTYDDGSREFGFGSRADVTWSSSNPSVVTVSNGEIVIDGFTHLKGSLIASALPGDVGQTATITAVFRDGRTGEILLSASQVVVVRPGTLEVSPTRQTLALGTALQMFATAIFGQDGVTDSTGTNLAADFTAFVDWSSDNTAVAEVIVTSTSSGTVVRVQGVGAGTANITAKTGANCPVPADLTTQVTVQDTDLSDFDFIPTNLFDFSDIGLATTSFVRLIGNFANGLRQDLTGQAELTSDDSDVVSEFSNLVTGKGAASATDSTTLTASFDQDGSGSDPAVTDAQPVTVDDGKSLSTLAISPAGPVSMFQGTTLDLDVLGGFDDATTQSLYRNVLWTTSDNTLATVNLAGIVSVASNDTGDVTLTAARTDPLSSTEFTPTLMVSVVSALNSANLQVVCADPIQIGTVADCRATATLAGGQTQDVSLSAVWSSANAAIAEVSNTRLLGARRNELGSASPLPGRVYAVALGGPVEIRASLFDADGNRLATGTDTVTVTNDPPPPPDADGDGVTDASDNCPNDANAGQENNDGDALGDICDPDDDNDGDLDGADNCPLVANADQANTDGDALGDACDADDDNDGVADAQDQCAATPDGAAVNAQGCPDSDADGVFDNEDMCPAEAAGANPSNSRPGCPCNQPLGPICLE